MAQVFDAAVIGAGPAGSTAAYHLAREGARVLLLDRSPFPRPKPCAGALFHDLAWPFDNLRAIRDRLPLQGVDEAALYHDRRPIGAFRAPNLFSHCARDEFDYGLQQEAIRQGAEFRVLRVQNIERDGGAYLIGEGRGRIRAQAVIGADGFGGVTSRLLGNPRPALSRCMEYDLRCDPADARSHLFFLWNGEMGYAWLFPTRDGYYAGLGFMGRSPQRIPTQLTGFLAHLVAQGIVPMRHEVRRCLGGVDPLSVAPRYAEGRMLLCGDAMGMVAQISGAGIYYAMMSGVQAAAALTETDPATAYRRRMRPYIREVRLFPRLPPPALGRVLSQAMLSGMTHIPALRDAVMRRFFMRTGRGLI